MSIVALIHKKTRVVFLTLIALLAFMQAAHSQSAFWTTASSTGFTARWGLSSSIVDGKIYVIGGVGQGGFLNTLEVYNPIADNWTTPQTTGGFSPHYGHTSAVVDGKIYVFGGVSNQITYHDSVFIFDPSTNVWSSVLPQEGRTFTERVDVTSSVLGDEIYVIGGELGPYFPTNVVEIFNTKTNLWRVLEPANDSFYAVMTPVSSVIDGKLYVVGNPLDTSCHCEVQIYDPQVNKWSIPANSHLNVTRDFFSANSVNGKIYVIGGNDVDHGGFPQGITEVYDPALNKWDTLRTTGTFTSRDYQTSSAIGENIYVLGGHTGIQLNTNEVLHLVGSGVEQQSGKILYNQRVYPNPATTTLNMVSFEPSMPYKIIDVLGRVVLFGKTLDHATLSIDISSIPKGIYYILAERSDIKGAYSIAGKIAVIDP